MDAAPRKHPAFPMPPKSALFDRLEAFLPKLASENKKLEDAIANGDGDRHNIEIPEPDAVDKKDGEDERDVEMDDDDDEETKPTMAPVIEMNFALGLMEEGGSNSDSSDDEDEETEEIDLAASIAAARIQPGASDEKSSKLQLPNDKPSKPSATRPLIQELN